MPKISVTYKAPPGESKVTELFGHTFFDGKPETVEVDDRQAEKLKNHALFTVGEGHAAPDPKPEPKKPDDDDHSKKHR